MPWKLKTTEDGAAVVQDELPVFLDTETGKEEPIDPNRFRQKILEVNAEAKSRREKIEEFQGRLEPVKDIENLAEFVTNANKALETVKNLEDTQLVEAGKVEQIKADAKRGLEETKEKLLAQFATREDELQKEVAARDAHIRHLMVSSRFAANEHFSGTDPKTVLPPDIAETYFGKHFDVVEEGGRLSVVAKDAAGSVIMSRDPTRLAEPAEFDEAMEIIFATYPKKEKLLRAGPGGSGATGGAEGPGAKNPAAQIKQRLATAEKNKDIGAMIRAKTQLHEL
jgi:hypothetical protein